MTQTTDEYWDVDGVGLQTYAFNISSWGGSRWGAPPLKGSDVDVEGGPGEAWQPKLAGPRTITLAGWVRGTKEDGTLVPDPHARMTANWRALRKLLWTPRRQIALTKRWRLEDETILQATAMAQFTGGLEPDSEDMGTSAAKFTVDLRLAFPYFVAAQVGPITYGPGAHTLTIPGDDATHLVVLEFNPTDPTMYIQNNDTGQRVTVDRLTVLTVATFTTSNGTELNVVRTGGDPGMKHWFYLWPGDNHLTVSGGAVNVRYQALYA